VALIPLLFFLLVILLFYSLVVYLIITVLCRFEEEFQLCTSGTNVDKSISYLSFYLKASPPRFIIYLAISTRGISCTPGI
jgi:hypothetical protein